MSPAHGVEVPLSPLAVLRRILDEGFSQGRTEVIAELCSPDLVEHQFGLAGQGAAAIEAVQRAIRELHAAVPDITLTIEDAVEHGDTVWVRARGTGTAMGPFFGPPSNRSVDVTVVDVARVVDGRLAEHWGVPDRFAMLAQTGVLGRLAQPA